MNIDRRAILSLIALGRISPREAERLLAVTSDEDDFILKVAVCVAIAWLALPQVHPLFAGLEHGLGALAPALWACMQCGTQFFVHLFGGMS